MSGHSHYATIHRQKEAKDAARGNLFSKMARAIAIAVKAGGGADPDTNFKLRVAIEKARGINMPKDNIQRAITKGSGGEAVDEVTYEGFGPCGISLIVETATDNRNRTGQEIKNIFERSGGRFSGPGSVSFNFENKGLLVVKKDADPQSQMLKLIDLGVEDIEETDDGIEIYVAPEKLKEIQEKLIESGFSIISMELYMRPKIYQTITDPKDAARVLGFLDTLNEHDDVQKVYANIDIPDEVIEKTTTNE